MAQEQQQIAVVGVGEMGRATLGILLRRLPNATFKAIDRSAEAVAAAVALDPARVQGIEAEIRPEGVTDLSGCSIVINLAGPFYTGGNTGVARSALDAGCSYVDISDDVEGAEAIFALHDEAVAAGVTVMSGAGLSPGLTNVMARRALELDPECDGLVSAFVVQEPDPGGLAPLRHTLHMGVAPCVQWHNGERTVTKGFVPETAETFTFPEPIGQIDLLDAPHPEPVSLARSFPELRFLACKGALMPAWSNATFSSLAKLGFSDKTVRVRYGDLEIDPAEFLWRMLWLRYERKGARPRNNGLSAAQVIGLVGDEPSVRLTAVEEDRMSRGTGLGAAAIAMSMLERPLAPGAHGAEALDAEPTLALFASISAEEGAFGDGVLIESPVAA
jgi:saccharopine dehydrogenase-like NADP-dependent oxidoreductase